MGVRKVFDKFFARHVIVFEQEITEETEKGNRFFPSAPELAKNFEENVTIQLSEVKCFG